MPYLCRLAFSEFIKQSIDIENQNSTFWLSHRPYTFLLILLQPDNPHSC